MAVGQFGDDAREERRCELTEPQSYVRRARKLRKWRAANHESDRGLRPEACARHCERKKKRRKAYRQIGKPRVSARKAAYRGLYVRAKTPEPTLHEFFARSITRTETALGAQHMQLHERDF
jgi:hypothetical protein